MKHLIKTIVVVAAVLLAAGCNKETLPTPQPADQTRHVGYVKCGEPGNATVTGEEAWHALLDTLFDATLEGCAITLWDADLAGAQQAKETVTYSTASRDSAYAWGERMYNQGYAVSVIYDPLTGQYNCSAVRTSPLPSGYTPIPLEQYLPGRWIIDSTTIYVLFNHHADSTQDWIFYDGHYFFDSIGCIPWDLSLASMIYDSVNNQWHTNNFRMHEELIITPDSITRPYPLIPGRTILAHEAMGLYDSTITYHYEINERNVLGPIINLPITENEHSTIQGNYCPYDMSFQVFQINYDTMVLFGYIPVIEEGNGLYYFGKSWAFNRQ